MKLKISIYIIILTLISTAFTYSKPRVRIVGADDKGITLPPTDNVSAFIKAQTQFDANNVDSWVQNSGTFDQDIRTNNTPGLMWPKNSNRFAIFTAGLSIGTYIEGALRLATASYAGEYQPGYIDANGSSISDDRFKIYKISAGDNSSSNPDYANWGIMVPFGAPYVDKNNNGTYDPGVDEPGIKDAAQTIFVCLTDGFPENHSSSEGFSGGTEPIKAQVQLTLWAYDTQGVEDLQFVNWVVINKNSKAWDRTHFSVVVDPDLGDADDDYIGCDTSASFKDMAFCYNSDNNDGNGNTPTYGANPPASGMDFFKSPAEFTGNPNDSIVYFDPPGSENRVVKTGWRALGLTSFVFFTNTGAGGITCEQDPSLPIEAYNYMTGIKKDGTPWVYPSNLQPTKFCYPGDPQTETGWSEKGTDGTASLAYVDNCGGALTGTVGISAPGDRRFIFNSGDSSFTVQPNDTQNIVLGQFVARGSNNLTAVKKLKSLDQVAQNLFNANFKVNPPPPLPVVEVSVTEATTNGTCNLTLSWGDTSESYSILDSLLQPVSDSSYLVFEGYQVYELDKFADNLPDFFVPTSIDNTMTLLRIFDKVDSIGIITDTLSTGSNDSGEVYGEFPVVPPYGISPPTGFPNTGINRSITISQTNYSSNYSGRSELIYGNTYRFAVIAYAYRTNPTDKSQRTMISNSLLSAIIDITPEAPLAGTEFTLKNDDTLSTSRRDLGVIPIIQDQEKVLTAKYRILFRSPDTTYNVLRSFNGGTSFDTLKKDLKFTDGTAQDSARIIDGVLTLVKKIKSYNTGVIRDITDTAGTVLPRDSIQTRFNGWSYVPSSNRKLEGSKYIRDATKPWQSGIMSMSWPTTTTFTGVGSLVKADGLRRVEIEFTGPGNGQKAYRYLDTSATTDNFFIYQDFVDVPFKVYEVDQTDSTGSTRRQLNAAFVVSNDVSPAPAGWEPSADSLGGKLLTYVFSSDYSATPDPFYTSKNLFLSILIDIYYVWAPKLITAGSSAYTQGDLFTIYPYTVTRPDIAPGYPLYYDFETIQPSIGNTQLASTRGDLDKINIVPNPYYGFNDLETNLVNRFVTFRRLPEECTIKIYTLNGDMIRQLDKDDTESTLQYDLNNLEGIPIASGMYIALLDAPGIGQKVLKFAVMTAVERINL